MQKAVVVNAAKVKPGVFLLVGARKGSPPVNFASKPPLNMKMKIKRVSNRLIKVYLGQ